MFRGPHSPGQSQSPRAGSYRGYESNKKPRLAAEAVVESVGSAILNFWPPDDKEFCKAPLRRGIHGLILAGWSTIRLWKMVEEVKTFRSQDFQHLLHKIHNKGGKPRNLQGVDALQHPMAQVRTAETMMSLTSVHIAASPH